MFFNLPDGTRFAAKSTKRGQHLYGVAYYTEFLASEGTKFAGEVVGYFGLASQHLTLSAAERAATAFAADSSMAKQVSVIEAA